jgi:hypothetical protein
MLSVSLRPRLALAAAAVCLAAATAPAFALCAICTPAVRLDTSLATCFAERADAEMQKLKADGHGFVMVDLSDCVSRGGLPTGEPAAGADAQLDQSFIADAASLTCLSQAIAAHGDAMDPSTLFDLTTLCQ